MSVWTGGRIKKVVHLGSVRGGEKFDDKELVDLCRHFKERLAEARLLKADRRCSVHAGLVVGGRPLCLKVYSSLRRARRAFERLWELQLLKIPAPEPLFLWERARSMGGGGVVAMEDLSPTPELDRWISDRLAEPGGNTVLARRSLRPVFTALGALIREYHRMGLDLDDLKTCNIFLEVESPPLFRFVDVDGSRWGPRPVTLCRRARGLGQLDRSTPLAAGLAARAAFWREYRRGLTPGQARSLRRQALAWSARRPVVYVARDGVREEPWPKSVREWVR